MVLMGCAEGLRGRSATRWVLMVRWLHWVPSSWCREGILEQCWEGASLAAFSGEHGQDVNENELLDKTAEKNEKRSAGSQGCGHSLTQRGTAVCVPQTLRPSAWLSQGYPPQHHLVL